MSQTCCFEQEIKDRQRCSRVPKTPPATGTGLGRLTRWRAATFFPEVRIRNVCMPDYNSPCCRYRNTYGVVGQAAFEDQRNQGRGERGCWRRAVVFLLAHQGTVAIQGS
jgi:hypothetical protein